MKNQKTKCTERIRKTLKEKCTLEVITERLLYFALGSIIFSFIFNGCQSFYSYNGVILNYATSNSKLIDKELYDKNTLHNDSLYRFEKELVIFNAGDEYLDFSRILNDRKIKFTFNSKVENFKIEDINTSRSNLDSLIHIQIEDKNSVTLQFLGDEALETMDGIQIFLSYYGEENITISQENRIKGISNGLKKVGFAYFDWMNLFLMIFGSIMLTFGIICLISDNSKLFFYSLFSIIVGAVFLYFALIQIDFKNARNIEWVVENLIINQSLIT